MILWINKCNGTTLNLHQKGDLVVYSGTGIVENVEITHLYMYVCINIISGNIHTRVIM